MFKHWMAVTYLFNYLIADFLSSPGCSLEQTAVQPALQSERRRARLLLAAPGRAWTRSAFPPVTPVARQTVRASPPHTPPTPSRTRWVNTVEKMCRFWSYLGGRVKSG